MTPPTPPTPRLIARSEDLDTLRFDAQGLLTVVVQEAATRQVLMVACANREALELTLQSGRMHFWSRSRGELWRKGATSGNTMEVISLRPDCDGDAILARVRLTGTACHTGTWSCFGTLESLEADPGAIISARSGSGEGGATTPAEAPASPNPSSSSSPLEVLSRLWATLEDRARRRPPESYTVRLLADENLRWKKLGEETVELATALARMDRTRATEEAADLLYHLLVALLAASVSLDELMEALRLRMS